MLKKCGCGKTPKNLSITQENSYKWAWVSGDCCGEWSIEFRTNYLDLESEECKALANEAWNSAPRGENEKT
jgi:hypothetical protein